MKPSLDPLGKTVESDVSLEPGYDAWKRAKVQRGLAQAEDRERLIPVERILRDFRLER